MKKKYSILVFLLAIPCIGFTQCGITFSWANSTWCECSGGATAIPTGAPPFHFLWSTGDSTNSIDSLCAGTYTLTMTDNNACIAIDSIIITQPSPMTFTISSTAVSCTTCNDACITTSAAGGCPPYSFVYFPCCPQPCQGVYGITYTVTITDDCNCSLTGTITPDTIPVGINELKENQEVNIYPNPATETITIEISSSHQEKKELNIYNTLAQKLLQENFTTQKHSVNISNFANGIYFIEVITKKQIFRRKIIKE